MGERRRPEVFLDAEVPADAGRRAFPPAAKRHRYLRVEAVLDPLGG